MEMTLASMLTKKMRKTTMKKNTLMIVVLSRALDSALLTEDIEDEEENTLAQLVQSRARSQSQLGLVRTLLCPFRSRSLLTALVHTVTKAAMEV